MIFHVGRFCVCFVPKLKGRWEQGVNWDCELLSGLFLYCSHKLLQQAQWLILYCRSLPVLHHVTSSTVFTVYSWTKGISSKFINVTFDGSCNKKKFSSFFSLCIQNAYLFPQNNNFCLKMENLVPRVLKSPGAMHRYYYQLPDTIHWHQLRLAWNITPPYEQPYNRLV